MATLDSLVPRVRYRIQGCPDFTLKFWLLEAAREFCRDTRWLRRPIRLDLLADQSIYALDSVEADEEIIGIKSVERVDDGHPLTPASPQDTSTLTTPGTPDHYWFMPTKEIVLSPTPSADMSDALTVWTIAQPLLGATQISDELVLRNDAALADGALAMLFALPKQEWTDNALATYHRDLWMDAKVKAKVRADKQHRPRNWLTAPQTF